MTGSRRVVTSNADVISETRMQMFLDTVRIANLLVEHGRSNHFHWAIGGRDRRLTPPDPIVRTNDGWIIQTAQRRSNEIGCLVCPWGSWFCFENGTSFDQRRLLPHLQFTMVLDQPPSGRVPCGTNEYVTHLDGRFLSKPAFMITEAPGDIWKILTEWHFLMEHHGVDLNGAI